ncbi:MAG TPA: redoxin domain-containing protein [Phycisphaerales bacterium]|nr:redoxin domain-containing protein [Phycisphaerales bacterium]
MKPMMLFYSGVFGLSLGFSDAAFAADGYGIGDSMPAFTAKDLYGDAFSTSQLSGQWVLLDFCAPWCAPCAAMAPDAVRVSDAFNLAGVPFTYVHALETNQQNNGPSTQANAEYWSQTFDSIWPVRIVHNNGVASAPMLQAFTNFGFTSFPSLVVISPNGTVMAKHVGLLSANDLVAFIAQAGNLSAPLIPGSAVVSRVSVRSSIHDAHVTFSIGQDSISDDSVYSEPDLYFYFQPGKSPFTNPFVQVNPELNTRSGTERWGIQANAATSGEPLPMDEQITLEFSQLAWQDGCETWSDASMVTMTAIDSNGFDVTFRNPNVPVSFANDVMTVGPIMLNTAEPSLPNVAAILIQPFDAFDVSPDLAVDLDPVVVDAGADGVWMVNVLNSGTGQLSFQWDRDGVPVMDSGNLGGTQSASLIINNAVATIEGYYGVTVSDGCRTVHTPYKRLAVRPLPCTADIAPIDGDGIVNIDDLTQIILSWGTNNAHADINLDGVVNIDDLTAIILAWGICG